VDPSIDIITIGATDLGRSAEFYEDGFGLSRENAGQESVTFRLGDSSALELWPWEALAADVGISPQSSGFRGFTLSYIVEQASDVDDMLTRLARAGGELVKTPKFAFWGYSGHVADPSGHLWKIASPKRRPLIARDRAANGLPDAVPAQELALTIGVADMKRAKRFYEQGLGNPTKKSYSKFVSFDGGGAPDLAMYNWNALADDAGVPAEGSGFRGFRISHVADAPTETDRLVEKAAQAGAKVLGGEPDGLFSDPDGFVWKIVAGA
jgi:uncharacterized protein